MLKYKILLLALALREIHGKVTWDLLLIKFMGAPFKKNQTETDFFFRMASLIGPDTIFTRMGSVLANRAGYYIY